MISRKKGGTNDIANLQWVNRLANIANSNFEESEFLELVSCIYDYRIKGVAD